MNTSYVNCTAIHLGKNLANALRWRVETRQRLCCGSRLQLPGLLEDIHPTLNAGKQIIYPTGTSTHFANDIIQSSSYYWIKKIKETALRRTPGGGNGRHRRKVITPLNNLSSKCLSYWSWTVKTSPRGCPLDIFTVMEYLITVLSKMQSLLEMWLV